MSIPGQTMGISVFTKHLLNSLGVTYMVGTLGSTLMLPIAGKFLDCLGPRVIAAIACFFLAFFMIILAKSPLLTQKPVQKKCLPHNVGKNFDSAVLSRPMF